MRMTKQRGVFLQLQLRQLAAEASSEARSRRSDSIGLLDTSINVGHSDVYSEPQTKALPNTRHKQRSCDVQ
jgi:hypothetical protein